MKKTIFSIFIMCFFIRAYNQAPQSVNYQAVVRNGMGNPLANSTPVALRFTIHGGSINGTPVYTETINTTTNQFGLVNLQIGSTANLSVVNWASGTKFLQVEAQINNSGSFTDMGITQMVSVPYALYADSSGSSGLGNGTAAGNTIYWNGTQWATNSNNIYNDGASVGIGTTAPDTSAELEVKSSSKGLLMPRLTQTQIAAIATPAVGLEVFNLNTGCINVWNGSSWTSCSTGTQFFTCTGTDQFFVVPAGVTILNVKLWGAGGGANGRSTSNFSVASSGGGGAFVSGALTVIPGRVLKVIVGQGGQSTTNSVPLSSYGGGGAGNNNPGSNYNAPGSASGGGRSAISISGNDIVTAAGGGGGGGPNAYPLNNNSTNWGNGGGGGATTGGNGVQGYSSGCAGGGGGATTSTPGAGGAGCIGGSTSNGSAGSLYQGGSGGTYTSLAVSGGAGGGGGYYGGGGGGGDGSGGGGGSSYTGGAGFTLISNVAGATIAGGGFGPAAAGGNGDTNYQSGIGVGAYSSNPASITSSIGGNGMVIISW